MEEDVERERGSDWKRGCIRGQREGGEGYYESSLMVIFINGILVQPGKRTY